jgi:hypothetical protein
VCGVNYPAAVLIPYLRVSALYGFERKADEVLAFSALPSDWLVSSSSNKLWGEISAQYRKGERELFPDCFPCFAVAAFSSSKHKRDRRLRGSMMNRCFVMMNRHRAAIRFIATRFDLSGCVHHFVCGAGILAASYGALQLFGVRILRASSPERALELCVAALWFASGWLFSRRVARNAIPGCSHI